MTQVTLSTPWIEFARKLHVLFGQDPDINIIYDNEATEVKLYINNAIKADALSRKLPTEKTFGNVTLKITVIPSNNEDSNTDIFQKIFTGNPILKEIVVDDNPMLPGFTHIIFENKVAQYFNDRLNDPMGLESTLYENLARDIFEDTGEVFFNTEASDSAEIWP